MGINTITVTDQNFSNEVLSSTVPVLVDFWAAWCGPCRMVAPIVDQVAEELAGSAKVCKINIDEQPKLAEQYAIMSIPTFMVFKNGKQVDKAVGVVPKSSLVDMLKKHT